ncbi:unannotated protein [freshwater metagenome]|uniref:Unannotated protein n=1 Tax=freshwater metagenome TaxID=449393 RepID=A0A6J7ANY6_9ZZZZ
MPARAMTADAQNTLCQPHRSSITPAIGSAMPPPMPSIALIIATAPITFCGASRSLARAMEMGRTAMLTPCNARPITSGHTEGETAAITEPTSNAASAPSITERLPYMSPNLPSTGLATAPPSSAAVETQLTSPTDACRRSGRSCSSGRATDWVSDTRPPQYARTKTTARAVGCGRLVSIADRVRPVSDVHVATLRSRA